MVQVANGGATTPSGKLAHFLAADYVRSDYFKSKTYLPPVADSEAKLAHFQAADYVRSDYLRPHLKSKTSYLTPDEQVLAKSDYLRPTASPRKSNNFLTPNEVNLAKSDYLRPPLSPSRSMNQPQPRSSLSLKADSVEVETRCKTLRPRVQHQSYSYSVHTLRRQARAVSPPCDCLPTEPIPPPELFDF